MYESHAAPVRRDGTRILAFLPVALCAWLTSACFGMQARAITAPEPLNMPEPPPRVVEVRDPEMPPPVPMPEEPVRTTPTPPPPRPRPASPATEAPRASEPARAESADGAKPADEAARPATTLQTTPAQQEGELERRIRTLLAQAMTDLNRINYQALNPDGRTQYDTAKRFVSQAEEAVRAKNLVFAGNLAEKAAALATQLAGR